MPFSDVEKFILFFQLQKAQQTTPLRTVCFHHILENGFRWLATIQILYLVQQPSRSQLSMDRQHNLPD